MHLFHLERAHATSISVDDSLKTKTALMIAEKVSLENGASSVLHLYKILFIDFTDEEYLNFLIDQSTPGTLQYDTLVKGLDKMKYHKKAKHKTPKQIKAYNDIVKTFHAIRLQHKEEYHKQLFGNGYIELIPFFSKEYFELIALKLFNEAGNKEDPYCEYMKTLLCNTNIIPLMSLPEINPAGKKDLIELTDTGILDELPLYINQPLYVIPNISDLTFDQLEYTRNNLLGKNAVFNKQLDELRKTCIDLEYLPDNLPRLQQLLAEILNDGINIQQAITDEMYVQMVYKAGVSEMVLVSLGITSLGNLIDMYEKTGFFKPYVAAVLKQRMDIEKGLSYSIIFLNMQVVAPDINYNIEAKE